MKKLVNRPLIDGQTFFIDHLMELAEEPFKAICSAYPLERALTGSIEEEIFLDDRTTEYIRLMDAHQEVMKIDAKVEVEDLISIDRHLSSDDRHLKGTYDTILENAPKVELKTLLQA